MCWRLHVSPPNNSLQRRRSSSTWNPFHFTHYVFQELVSEDFWIIRTGKNKTNLISLLKWNIWKVRMLSWWVICCSGTDEDTGGGARGRTDDETVTVFASNRTDRRMIMKDTLLSDLNTVVFSLTVRSLQSATKNFYFIISSSHI